MTSGGSDRNVEDTLSKLLKKGTVAEYQNEFEMIITRLIEARVEAIGHKQKATTEKEETNKETVDTLTSLQSKVASLEAKGSLDASEDTLLSLQRSVDEVCSKFAKFSEDKVFSATKLPEADVGIRKRVKCYVQGSGRRKRKKVIGRGLAQLNPGRRFYGCPTISPTCVNFLQWFDPPMCQRSVQIIPGLLRSRNELKEILTMVEEKRLKLMKFLIISWVVFFMFTVQCEVLG
ncbi:hypothetical protein Tco_0992188 [Tanacetum coccineum]|uniref:Uncharacterized protein n=1 Tax=Tanacetum coccineum TaxID=301880 RepID=A0ABQ5F1U1_9ASTR